MYKFTHFVLQKMLQKFILNVYPYRKVHGANMGPTWVLPVPDGPHIGPMYVEPDAVKMITFDEIICPGLFY